MSPSFFLKILCYTWRPFTIKLVSLTIICAERCLILILIDYLIGDYEMYFSLVENYATECMDREFLCFSALHLCSVLYVLRGGPCPHVTSNCRNTNITVD